MVGLIALEIERLFFCFEYPCIFLIFIVFKFFVFVKGNVVD